MGNDQKKPSQSNQSQYHPDIVVVSENKTQPNPEDESLNKLKFVPLFYPILKKSIDLKEDDDLYLMTPDRLVKLADLLKDHLSICAFNVTKDQEALSTEIKHLNFVVDLLMQNYLEKQKKYAKYCEQMKTVNDLNVSVKKIRRNMDEILPMIKSINEFLPEQDRLEEFSFR
ncbi:Loss of heterozygosity 12 chromosomal region 1 [Brachionus plicatilis]|uniref:BLOC-1-related complex subunit 5 n=1 Tax=Brachionus plicatilis TaxID=10195 RepID=A0A3M7S872_BRAPC|nr:Loss of heterozygosity 12 chromosomal region 1 [Brachionus plicatilis]